MGRRKTADQLNKRERKFLESLGLHGKDVALTLRRLFFRKSRGVLRTEDDPPFLPHRQIRRPEAW